MSLARARESSLAWPRRGGAGEVGVSGRWKVEPMPSLEETETKDLRMALGCMSYALEREVFPDWEFQTLMGYDEHEVELVIREWETGGLGDPSTRELEIGHVVLGTLLHYPGIKWGEIEREVGVSRSEAREIADRIRERIDREKERKRREDLGLWVDDE